MSFMVMIPLLALNLSVVAPHPVAIDNLHRNGGISAPCGEMKVNPETAKLRARIDSAIVLLEAGERRAILERFVEPAFIQEKGVDVIMEEFDQKKADQLLAALREARGLAPKYRQHGSLASFKLTKTVSVHGAINFIRVDGVWYLRN
jgi:hypothetical protein